MSDNTNHRQSLDQLMGEASVLPHDDAQRKGIERRIADSDSSAELRWRTLLDETKALRDAVPSATASFDPPAEFQERLLAIAEVVAKPNRWPRRWVWSVATIAALMLMVMAARSLHYLNQRSRLHTLAVLAINNHANHINDHPVSVKTSNAFELEQTLGEQLPFAVVVPRLGEQCRLVGGRKCKLGTHPVAYSLWETSDGKLSLFQCRSSDFGLSNNAPCERVQVRDVAIGEQLDTVLVWADDGWSFLLVGDSRSALDRVTPRKQRSH